MDWIEFDLDLIGFDFFFLGGGGDGDCTEQLISSVASRGLD